MEAEGSLTGIKKDQNQNDTIAACASPPGTGAISIIKLSGPDAIPILGKIFRSRLRIQVTEFENFRLYLGDIYHPSTGQELDEALAVVMRAPRSYTREDVVELQFHGGIYLAQRIFSVILESGAVPAPPGEFTRRAFINGRIDLTQAEAVSQIMRASSDKALSISHRILQGDLGNLLHEWTRRIVSLQAQVEAWVDYPDQEPVTTVESSIARDLAGLIDEMTKQLERNNCYRTIQDGYRVIITGKPNVGKSSLFNALIAHERAIVTEIAGTTRDVVEESVFLDGCLVRLADTAGIRKTEDPIEKLALEKAREYLKHADLVLAVIDQHGDLTDDDQLMADLVREKPVLVILNKSDLKKYISNDTITIIFGSRNIYEVSARTGQGIPELIAEISRVTSWSIDSEETALIVTSRQKDLLKKAVRSLSVASQNVNHGYPVDIICFDLAEARRSIGNISGENVDAQVENVLFSTFCVGK